MSEQNGLYKLSSLIGMFASVLVVAGGIIYSGAINLEQTKTELFLTGRDVGSLATFIDRSIDKSYYLFVLAVIFGLLSLSIWLYAYYCKKEKQQL